MVMNNQEVNWDGYYDRGFNKAFDPSEELPCFNRSDWDCDTCKYANKRGFCEFPDEKEQ